MFKSYLTIKLKRNRGIKRLIWGQCWSTAKQGLFTLNVVHFSTQIITLKFSNQLIEKILYTASFLWNFIFYLKFYPSFIPQSIKHWVCWKTVFNYLSFALQILIEINCIKICSYPMLSLSESRLDHITKYGRQATFHFLRKPLCNKLLISPSELDQRNSTWPHAPTLFSASKDSVCEGHCDRCTHWGNVSIQSIPIVLPTPSGIVDMLVTLAHTHFLGVQSDSL